MQTYQLKIQIEEGDKSLEKEMALQAESTSQLSEKLNALRILNQSVEHDDLVATVQMFHEKPELVPVIKQMLTEGAELSEAQLLMRLPAYVKKVLRVLKS